MIERSSRYARCLLYETSDGPVLGSRRRIDCPPRPDDRFHTVRAGDRIDLLAHHYLADARLWWIIADANDLFFPLILTEGTALRIPSFERIQMDLLD